MSLRLYKFIDLCSFHIIPHFHVFIVESFECLSVHKNRNRVERISLFVGIPCKLRNILLFNLRNCIANVKSCFHIFDCLYKCFGSSLIWHILTCNTGGNCKVMQLRIDGFSIAFKNHWENYCICKSMRNIIFAT